MGEEVAGRQYTREERQRYREKVRLCLDAFEQMLTSFPFDAERPQTGLEVELNLVDAGYQPAMRNAEVLEAIADPDHSPRCAVLALGCAGWSPGQLEREIKENVWLTCDPDEALIFDADHDTKWERALAKIGISAGQLSGQSGRA